MTYFIKHINRAILLSFFFIAGFSFISHARISGLFKKKPLIHDSSYVKSYRSGLVIRGLVNSKFNSITIRSKNSSDQVAYRPNVGITVGGGFNYKWLGLNLSFPIPSSGKNNGKYGTSTGFDLQAYIFMRKFMGNFFLERYIGYYVDASKLRFPGSLFIDDQEKVVTRPDLRMSFASFEINYIQNNTKFSSRAPFQHTEKQLKSAGSWLFGGFANINTIRADSAIIPDKIADTYKIKTNFDAITNYNIGASGGYIHTFVIKKVFYATLCGELGFGWLHSELYTRYAAATLDQDEENKKLKSNSLNTKVKAVVAIGYNHNVYFAGLSFTNTSFVIGREEVDMTLATGMFRFTLGRRF